MYHVLNGSMFFDNSVDFHLGGNILQSLLNEICRVFLSLLMNVVIERSPLLFYILVILGTICGWRSGYPEFYVISLSQSREILAIVCHIPSISSYAIVRPPFPLLKGT
jgi:hypothetical protein